MEKPWLSDAKKIISVDSSPFVGIADVCAAYAEICERMSIPFRFVLDGEGIVVNPLDEPSYVSYSSLETKDPGPHSFWDKTNYNPFDASISANQLYGLGVAGSKLSFLQQIYALKHLKESSGLPKVSLFGGSFSNMEEEMNTPEIEKWTKQGLSFLVSRPTSRRVLKGICGKAKVRFSIPLGEKEAKLKSQHFFEEDTATQMRIFRGVTTHGASLSAKNSDNALFKLVEYLKMLPQGVLILNMEAGHSTDQVPAEAVLELNLSQPVDDTVANKLIDLVEILNSLENRYETYRKEKADLLPTLNMGKLRHSNEFLFLDVSFFIPKGYSKEKLLLDLNQIRESLDRYKINFEIRQYLAPLGFKEPTELLDKMKHTFTKHSMDWKEGESVIESAARKLNEKSAPCLQFGIGAGLDNIDEPNETISFEDIDLSIQSFIDIMEQY